MSKHEKDGLLDCLFSEADMKLKNIKFFRGGRDLLTEDELGTEAHSAVLQKRLGAAKASACAPASEQPKVDVRAFVAEI